jgi:SsrA-binding protein
MKIVSENNKTISENRKVKYEYHIIEEFIAGIQLVGPEVKSIRNTKVSIKESYCQFTKNELFIKNMHISEYKEGTYNNVESLRDRKLLLTKRELSKLTNEIKIGGLTIVPLSLFINKKGLVKIKIALVKGKKLYDKRISLLEKDLLKSVKNLNL